MYYLFITNDIFMQFKNKVIRVVKMVNKG